MIVPRADSFWLWTSMFYARSRRAESRPGQELPVTGLSRSQPRAPAFRPRLELEPEGREFCRGTDPLIATKEPPYTANQPGHRISPSCELGLMPQLRARCDAHHKKALFSRRGDRWRRPMSQLGAPIFHKFRRMPAAPGPSRVHLRPGRARQQVPPCRLCPPIGDMIGTSDLDPFRSSILGPWSPL